MRLSDIRAAYIAEGYNNLAIEQEEYCFDLGKLDDSVTLLINTKEQIFVEKLKSLLRLGSFNTRYKDFYDMYWLATQGGINKAVFLADMKSFIFDDATMKEENMAEVMSRLGKVLNDSHYIKPLGKSKGQNWLNVDPAQAKSALLAFFKNY
jgi:hypothetical protein